jgi:hypothetical protein
MARAAGALAAAGLLAATVVPPACQLRQECTLLACGSTHAVITAHVKTPLASFGTAVAGVCWNEVCSPLVPSSDAGASSSDAGGMGAPIALETSGVLFGTATASAEGSDATLVHLELQFLTRNQEGTFDYKRQANGDRYRITVVDAQGKTVFDVERTAIYDEYYPNGPECDPDPCRRVALDFAAP